MNWMVDQREYIIAQQETSRSNWEASGNLLDNLITDSNTDTSARILSFTINGYTQDSSGSISNPELNELMVINSDGSFWLSLPDNWNTPLNVEYVIEQGGSTLKSSATVVTAQMQNSTWQLPPVGYVAVSSEGGLGAINGSLADKLPQDGSRITAFSFKNEQGETETYGAGTSAFIPGGQHGIGIGFLTINNDGTFSITPTVSDFIGQLPEITVFVQQPDNTIKTFSLQMEARPSESDAGERSILIADVMTYHSGIYTDGKVLMTGNVLEDDKSILDGEPFGTLEVTEFIFDGITYQAGETARDRTGLIEDFTIQRDGSFIYYATGSGVGPHLVSYTLSNGSKSAMSTLDIGIFDESDDWRMSDSVTAPDIEYPYPAYPDADEQVDVNSNHITGMVLDTPFGTSIYDRVSKITGFSINGMQYKTDDIAAIYGLGTFTINRNGYYELKLEGQGVKYI